VITQREEAYLQTIPTNKKVAISPYNPRLSLLAQQIINEVQQRFPDATIRHLGAAALEIAGQNELDLYFLASQSDFGLYLRGIEKIFGKPRNMSETSVAWEFERDETVVEFYLTDPHSETMQRQIKVFELLQNNTSLRNTYEHIKKQYNGKLLKDYQRAKYEFYNAILSNSLSID